MVVEKATELFYFKLFKKRNKKNHTWFPCLWVMLSCMASERPCSVDLLGKRQWIVRVRDIKEMTEASRDH